MPDQPDWLRNAPGVGTPVFSLHNFSTTQATGIAYVGQWVSYKIAQEWSTSSTFGTWLIVANFYTDQAGTNQIGSQNITITNGFGIDGWRPILGPYMKLSVNNFIAGVGELMSIDVLPSLMEGLVGARGVPREFCNDLEQVMNHNQFADVLANFVYGGPAIVEFRCNVFNVTFDLYTVDTSGLYTQTRRWALDVVNEARQFAVLLPDTHWKIRVTNNAPHSAATFDVVAFPT